MARRPHSFLAACLVASLAALPAQAADGYGDPTFSDDGIAIIGWSGGADRGVATAVAALPDGSLLVGGDVEGGDFDTDFAVVKLRSDGDLDLGWGSLGRRRVPIDAKEGGQDELQAIVPLADGSILLAGAAEVDNADQLPYATMLPAVARLTAGGALDSGFGTAGVRVVQLPWPTIDHDFEPPVAQPDGKILFAGYCYDCPDNSDDARPVFLRLTTAGEPDPTFGNGGWSTPTGAIAGLYPYRLAVDASGRIVVLGSQGAGLVVARLTAGGDVDATFGGTGVVALPGSSSSPPFALALDRNGGAIFAAYLEGDFATVRRVAASGVLDATYAGDGAADLIFDGRTWATAMQVQSDGKLVGVGLIRSVGGDQDHFHFRLLPSGALDSSFHANGARRLEFGQDPDETDYARAMTLSGGRLVGVGLVTVGGNYRFGISRSTSALVFQDGFERGSTGGWGGS